jgi:hypothetical protein
MLIIFVAQDAYSYSVKIKSDDPADFNLAINTLKSYISPDARTFDPQAKQWNIAKDADEMFQRWLVYARTVLGAKDEWLKQGEARRERPHAPPRHPKASDPYVTLHLLPSAPPEVVKAAYKALATLHHPDKPGGETEVMQRINAAYRTLAA